MDIFFIVMPIKITKIDNASIAINMKNNKDIDHV